MSTLFISPNPRELFFQSTASTASRAADLLGILDAEPRPVRAHCVRPLDRNDGPPPLPQQAGRAALHQVAQFLRSETGGAFVFRTDTGSRNPLKSQQPILRKMQGSQRPPPN